MFCVAGVNCVKDLTVTWMAARHWTFWQLNLTVSSGTVFCKPFRNEKTWYEPTDLYKIQSQQFNQKISVWPSLAVSGTHQVTSVVTRSRFPQSLDAPLRHGITFRDGMRYHTGIEATKMVWLENDGKCWKHGWKCIFTNRGRFQVVPVGSMVVWHCGPPFATTMAQMSTSPAFFVHLHVCDPILVSVKGSHTKPDSDVALYDHCTNITYYGLLIGDI